MPSNTLFASIVAWAIEGAHPTRIGYYDRDHLAEAYEVATGEQAPTLITASTPTVVAPAPITTATAATDSEPPQ